MVVIDDLEAHCLPPATILDGVERPGDRDYLF